MVTAAHVLQLMRRDPHYLIYIPVRGDQQTGQLSLSPFLALNVRVLFGLSPLPVPFSLPSMSRYCGFCFASRAPSRLR